VMYGYFKVDGTDVKALEFGHSGREFNGVRGGSVKRAELRRQLRDSFEIGIEKDGDVIPELKLTNQQVLTWDDHWVEGGEIVDPGIQVLNLSRNRLVYVNINTPRPSLTRLDLSGNTPLQVLHLHECPELTYLDISGCRSLVNIALGINGRIQSLIAKDCEMGSDVMEQLLRDFTPTITSSSNVSGAGVFRLQQSTLLDLRGNEIDWSNRRIASKIRLLLTNNWVVKWSNNPPVNVIPTQLYSRYVESRIERSRFN
jgi:hypothetical protein